MLHTLLRTSLTACAAGACDSEPSRHAVQVSSSAVRSALEAGQVELVSQLLGRRHRLIVQLPADCRTSSMTGER